VPGVALGEGIGTADWQACSARWRATITSPTRQRDLAAAQRRWPTRRASRCLVDLRPGLVIIESGKDQWEDEAHGPELDFTDLAGTSRPLPATRATADPGLPRFAQLFLDAATSPRSARSGSPHSIHPRRRAGSATSRPAAAERCWYFQSSTLRRPSGAGSATASTSSSPCPQDLAQTRLATTSQPVAGSLRSRGSLAGRRPRRQRNGDRQRGMSSRSAEPTLAVSRHQRWIWRSMSVRRRSEQPAAGGR